VVKPNLVNYGKTFIKDTVLHLADIQPLQDLDKGDWWEGYRGEGDPEIVITRTITIMVTLIYHP